MPLASMSPRRCDECGEPPPNHAASCPLPPPPPNHGRTLNKHGGRRGPIRKRDRYATPIKHVADVAKITAGIMLCYFIIQLGKWLIL